jgi:hypothetical protein
MPCVSRGDANPSFHYKLQAVRIPRSLLRRI